MVYNSFDDLRVFSQEIGDNIARFNQVGVQEGDVLDLWLAFDSLSGTAQLSFAQNDGSRIVLAEETDLLEFTPNNVDLLLFKFGEGNGNAPRLQLDHFEITDGFLPVEVQPFIDDFDGPELMSGWTPLGSEADQIGFNEDGQYEVKGAENAGLKLRCRAPRGHRAASGPRAPPRETRTTSACMGVREVDGERTRDGRPHSASAQR